MLRQGASTPGEIGQATVMFQTRRPAIDIFLPISFCYAISSRIVLE
jgi:hypothetical protein